jgi:hypothetical protein
MHLVLNLHDGDKLTFEELNDAKELGAIDFDLDKVESLDLYYDKYNSICLWFNDMSTEDRTETFYKYLYIVDTFSSLESVYTNLNNIDELDAANYYHNDREFFDLYFKNDPYKAVQAAKSNDYRISSKFVTFDGNGNLESADTIPYENDANDIINRYFEQSDIDTLWNAKLTATHSSGYITSLECEFYSEFGMETLEENAKDELWEKFEEAYEDLDEDDDIDPRQKALIEHIVELDTVDPKQLPDWTIELIIYTV